ncbi:MAG: hypothetical protein ABI758_00025 [Candidatus Woesebacteria bacterium]
MEMPAFYTHEDLYKEMYQKFTALLLLLENIEVLGVEETDYIMECCTFFIDSISVYLCVEHPSGHDMMIEAFIHATDRSYAEMLARTKSDTDDMQGS